MARKRKKLTAAEYLANFLRRYNIHSLSEYIPNQLYIAKLREDKIRYCGPKRDHIKLGKAFFCSTDIEEKNIEVDIFLDKEQNRNLLDEENYWGFLRFSTGIVDTIYQGYEYSRELWTNPDILENDGIGTFVRVNIKRKEEVKPEPKSRKDRKDRKSM